MALITLNRPARMNSWTERFRDEFLDAVATANQDRGIGAIVVTGADRGFCAVANVWIEEDGTSRSRRIGSPENLTVLNLHGGTIPWARITMAD